MNQIEFPFVKEIDEAFEAGVRKVAAIIERLDGSLPIYEPE